MTERKPISHKLRVLLFQKQGGKCAMCKCALVGLMEFDHIQALCHGGDNAPDNWRILCTLCHKLKTKLDKQAKAKVQRLKFGRPRKSQPMAGTRASGFKKRMDGVVERR